MSLLRHFRDIFETFSPYRLHQSLIPNVLPACRLYSMNYKYNSVWVTHTSSLTLRDIVELLLSYEASCNSADDKGSSPLHLASWAGHAPIVEVLLTRGPSISNVNLTVNELLDLQGNLTFLVWLLSVFLTQFFLISLILKNSRVVVMLVQSVYLQPRAGSALLLSR